MVSNSIILQRDAETVWAKIQEEFCKAFNCRDEDLLGRTITVKTRNYWGNPIQVTQKVTEFSPPQSIAIQSQNRKDIVTTRYRVEALGARRHQGGALGGGKESGQHTPNLELPAHEPASAAQRRQEAPGQAAARS